MNSDEMYRGGHGKKTRQRAI